MDEWESSVEGMVGRLPDPSFWAGRRVLLTGHTGFKGSWAASWLVLLKANVFGLSLEPETDPNLFRLIGDDIGPIESVIGDIRDASLVREVVNRVRPNIVLHMAAQALVRRSYVEPIDTMSVNALGTAVLLDCLRSSEDLQGVLVVTTDKVYRNEDDGRAFRESDPLGGADPYSASKAAAEMVTASWAASYFASRGIVVASARAGNVVGGGDWSQDRIVPDLWRAVRAGQPVQLRNPSATRPWQHVLDPLCGYLVYLEDIAAKRPGLPLSLNFAPRVGDVLTVADVTDLILRELGSTDTWQPDLKQHPHEMKLLALDASLANLTLGWSPRLTSREALVWAAEWYRKMNGGTRPFDLVRDQIVRYMYPPRRS